MQSITDRKRSPEFTVILGIFEVVSLLGLMYSVLVLLGLQSSELIPRWKMLIYTTWFAVSTICVSAMLSWKKWGAYGLGIATLVIALVNILTGSATWGGASLGALVAILLFSYLRPHWVNFD